MVAEGDEIGVSAFRIQGDYRYGAVRVYQIEREIRAFVLRGDDKVDEMRDEKRYHDPPEGD